MSNLAHEVFGNYDYEYAAEQRRTGEKGIVQKLGERAVKWFRGMNKKRKAEKAVREHNGSLGEVVPFTKPPQEGHVAEPSTSESGVYKSKFTEVAPELTQAETDDIMAQAVARARKNLGALPVATLTEDRAPTPSRPQTLADVELIERLEKAFNNPREADRSDHIHREAEDDDTLVSTKGK